MMCKNWNAKRIETEDNLKVGNKVRINPKSKNLTQYSPYQYDEFCKKWEGIIGKIIAVNTDVATKVNSDESKNVKTYRVNFTEDNWWRLREQLTKVI